MEQTEVIDSGVIAPNFERLDTSLIEWIQPRVAVRKGNSHYKGFKIGEETFMLRDCAYFASPIENKPFIGMIVSLWETPQTKQKTCKVRWFYRPEDANFPPDKFYANEIFESEDYDNNNLSVIVNKVYVTSAEVTYGRLAAFAVRQFSDLPPRILYCARHYSRDDAGRLTPIAQKYEITPPDNTSTDTGTSIHQHTEQLNDKIIVNNNNMAETNNNDNTPEEPSTPSSRKSQKPKRRVSLAKAESDELSDVALNSPKKPRAEVTQTEQEPNSMALLFAEKLDLVLKMERDLNAKDKRLSNKEAVLRAQELSLKAREDVLNLKEKLHDEREKRLNDIEVNIKTLEKKLNASLKEFATKMTDSNSRL